MKIAIPLIENSQASKLSMTFGRSNYFALVDRQKGKVEIVENPFVDYDLKVGQLLMDWLTIEKKVNTLVAFELGWKVHQVANDRQLQLIIINEKNRTLKQLLSLMRI